MQRIFFHNDLTFRLIRHLLFIAGTLLLFSMLLFISKTQLSFWEALKITAANSFFFLGYAYLTLFLLIPFVLLKGEVARFLLLFVLAGIGLSVLKLLISDEIFYASVAPEYFKGGQTGTLGRMLINAKDMTFFVALFCVGKFTKDFIYTEGQLCELEKQNREAHQRLLQSQLNPHFLYNTINNLYALSLLEPDKTLAVTKRIQKVLGYIVEQSRYSFINLSEELELMRNYVSLEKLRYGKRLSVQIISKGNIEDWKVPPMVLFLITENGIRHGSRSDTGNSWLRIAVDAQPGMLVLEGSNSKPKVHCGNSEEPNGGTGLKNLKNRLEILYPQNSYRIQVEENEHSFSIRLTLSKLKNGFEKTLYRWS